MGKKISVRKNYIYNLIYQLVALMVPLITTPYVSRVLGADGVGAYSYTYSMATYFVMFGNLGVNEFGKIQVAGAREDKKEISRLFWELVLFKTIMTTGSFVVFWITLGMHSRYWKLYLVLGLYFLASVTDTAWFLQGLEEFKKTAFRSCSIKIAGVVLIILFVKNPADIYKYAAILHISTILGNIALWGYMPRYLVKVPFKELRIFRHTKQSLVFFLPVVAASVYSIMDKNMIGWITKSEAENGYYEQAHKIQQTILQAVLALSAVLLPRITYLFREEKVDEIKGMINRLLQFVALISFPLSFGLMGVADKLVPWFLGEEFLPSIRLLQIFSLLILIIAYDDFVGLQCLIARGMQKEYNKGIVMGAAVNFILNLFFIPRLGSQGAAISSVLSETVIFFVFFYYGREFLKIRDILCFSGRYFLSATAMLFCVVAVGKLFDGPEGMAVQIGVGGIIYFLSVWVLGDKLMPEYLAKGWERIRSLRKGR
ncbi:MAG: oligosaccharide flippase family protein [Clostridiales bacterium]|nr:oligosaccharide flippase family protein [Clostridiales bacterium]